MMKRGIYLTARRPSGWIAREGNAVESPDIFEGFTGQLITADSGIGYGYEYVADIEDDDAVVKQR